MGILLLFVPEAEQQIGKDGSKRVKALLEASMRFRLPYNAYHNKERVQLPMLTGRVETYDLTGDHLDEDAEERTRIYVESKNLMGAGSQNVEFRQFLAQAYSATAQARENLNGSDPKYDFMWATTCPWIGDGFRAVASKEKLLEAIEEFKDDEIIPVDHTVDQALVDLVAERIWVWVISERHEDMSPSERMKKILRAELG